MDALTRLLATAQAREAEGDRQAACALMDGAPGPLRERALWAYARAALAFRGGQLEQAETLAAEAVQREPAVPEYRGTLGAVLLERYQKTREPGLLDRALRELLAAVAPGPLLPHARAQLALAQLLSGQPAEALQSADAALKQDGRFVPALWHRALALEALGRAEESAAAVTAVLAERPDFAPARARRPA
jgi:tetratricopeptide (TPR) repeat protein